jgi:RNA polymerase sigma-70 factor (ECF subfamily)
MAESDAYLVTRVRSGDTAAFEGLMRRHFRVAYLVALARMNNAADAEDICQEAFVSAWQHIHECREPERFVAWLLRIVRNTAHNRADYLRVRAVEPLDDAASIATMARADDSVLRNELRENLHRALEHLKPVQREIVLLHDLDGWKHHEIAARLNVSEAMSRRHLSDARKRLREVLGDTFVRAEDHD